MATAERTTITVEADIKAPVEKIWECWTNPKHITKWNFASEDWHSPSAENDLKIGGRFKSRMEAKDGSNGFDFSGVYDDIKTHKLISYSIDDGRKVNIAFIGQGDKTKVTESFEAENTFPTEMQREGWQAILNNFKKYVESLNNPEKIQFEILINAPVKDVYSTMIDKNSFRIWTAEFNPSSRFEGSWEKGSKILFIGVDEKGKESGMVSRIKENIPNQFISIEHLGLFQDGKEVLTGPEVEGWAGAFENYTFKEENGKTRVLVDMDINEDFKAYFDETWPKALNKLKEICEK